MVAAMVNLNIGDNFELPATNARFKRLRKEFGTTWTVRIGPWNMPCFNGQLGITAAPVSDVAKVSNFLMSDFPEDLVIQTFC